ncbi:MAG: hypothetical protein H4O13_07390 [Xanthomonadales bacterium]|nr:hypothetical protein [Xanthomonadales bacterium]
MKPLQTLMHASPTPLRLQALGPSDKPSGGHRVALHGPGEDAGPPCAVVWGETAEDAHAQAELQAHAGQLRALAQRHELLAHLASNTDLSNPYHLQRLQEHAAYDLQTVTAALQGKRVRVFPQCDGTRPDRPQLPPVYGEDGDA